MRWLLALLAMLMVAATPTLTPAAVRAAPRNWTRIVTQTPVGAYVLGNPKARVKLVEYLSLTCSHCAHFTAEAWAPLKTQYIAPGLVNLEIRHAIRDGYDLSASLLARCAGPGAYFGATEAVLAAQPEWAARASSFAESSSDLDGKPVGERLTAMAKGAGLDQLFAKRGLAAPRAAACLANKAEQDRLAAMAKEAWQERQIGGTPAFLINGEAQSGVFSWATLEPRLQAALK